MTDPAPRPACPVCGASVPDDAPSGACPRCLLGAGIAADDAGADAPGAADVAARFPDHEVLGLLGRGGMGVVWKTRQRALDRVVALKVLPRDAARSAGFAERFRREARALARLAHPNIVAVHEFGDRDGMFFLVMEYVDGTNMRQAMREGRIAPRDVLRIVPQICDALQYAHDHGVVHRDIKPENVLVAADGRVKVADFGLAKIVGGEPSADLTLTGHMMGTPAYMAPEQVERPTSVDHRADIYSLGVVFYEMLTGELPLGRFDAPSKRVQVDVRLDEVVLRSLEKAPERRWQRASEVKSEVGTIAAAPPRPGPAEPAGLPPSIWGFSDGTRMFLLRLLIGSSAAAVTSFTLAALHRPTALRLAAIAVWTTVFILSVRRHAAWKRLLARGGPDAPRAAEHPRTGRDTRPVNRAAAMGVGLLGIASIAAATAVATEWETGIGVAVVLAGLAVIVACALGIVAWVQIARSRGTQRGAVLAGIATFSPLVSMCVAAPAVLLLSGLPDPGTSAAPTIDGAVYLHEPVEVPTEYGFVARWAGGADGTTQSRDAREIHDAWTRFAAAAPVSVERAADHYAPETWKRLASRLGATGVPDDVAAGACGLPLMDPSWIDAPIATSVLERVVIDAGRARCVLTIRCGGRRMRVTMERSGASWFFAALPVVFVG